MPKKTYVGVNNKAKNVPSKGYIGITNKAKKLLKGYIGDANGKARLFWGKKIGSFWFFYETKELTQIFWTELFNRRFQKYNSGIAFFALFKHASSQGGSADAYTPFLISTDEDAVTYRAAYGGWSPLFTARGNVTIDGDTWYWAGWSYAVYGKLNPYPTGYKPDCMLSNKAYYVPNANVNNAVVDDMLANIYADDFAEDYHIQTKYNAVWTDREKTIRKALAIWLYKNYSFKGYNAYDTLLANLDTIINRLLVEVGNDDLIQVYFGRVQMDSNRSQIAIFIDSVDSSIYQPPFEIKPTREFQVGGYTYFMGSGSGYLQTTRTTYAYIEETNIRYISDTGRGYISTIGVIITAPSQYRVDYGVTLSNLGINL